MTTPRGPRTLAEAIADHDRKVAKIDRWERRSRWILIVAVALAMFAPFACKVLRG